MFAPQQQQSMQQGQAASGLLTAMTAGTGTHRGTGQGNIIDLMIDSGATTHVGPPWFAPKFYLQPLPEGEEPQLRALTDTHSQSTSTWT